MGRSEGIEPSSVEPQSTVLPLNYDRHNGIPKRNHRVIQSFDRTSPTRHPVE